MVDYSSFFREATSYLPYPYQLRLASLPIVSRALHVPTGAGKTTLLNVLSTCTMVRLGRVMGNYMVWVVPSNLKLIDRSTRYIQRLTGLEYREANQLLFEVIEYVEPRIWEDAPEHDARFVEPGMEVHDPPRRRRHRARRPLEPVQR